MNVLQTARDALDRPEELQDSSVRLSLRLTVLLPITGLGSSVKNSLKIGGSNKFERFNDGLEMSESRRMEGFGSGH